MKWLGSFGRAWLLVHEEGAEREVRLVVSGLLRRGHIRKHVIAEQRWQLDLLRFKLGDWSEPASRLGAVFTH